MVVVRLMALECMRTKEGLTEEPYINIWSDAPGGSLRFSYVETWGPVDMKTGQTRQITSSGEHIVVEGDRVQFDLYESDRSGSGGYLAEGPAPVGPNDDLPGVVTIRDLDAIGGTWEEGWGEGSYVADIPSSDEGRQRYKLYFELYEDRDSLERGLRWPFSLQLISIHCHDAQEGKDEVFIKVNGERVWDDDMKTGQTRDLSGLSAIPIRADATISLWEEDSSTRSDLFGEFSLHVDEDFDFVHDQPPHTFHRDRGIVGDARYTLTYRVTRRFSELRRWIHPRTFGPAGTFGIVDTGAHRVR
jgi:hypothetical protein